MKYERPSAPVDQIEETPRRKLWEVDPRDVEALKRRRNWVAILNAAQNFFLDRHKLYFQRTENLVTGSNFIKTAADFAEEQVELARNEWLNRLRALRMPEAHTMWNDCVTAAVEAVKEKK